MAAFKLNLADLVFVLKQIKIAEAHSSGTPLTQIWVDANGNVVPAGTPGATLAIPSPMAPYGLRTVDGSLNNIVPGRETWGAADQPMPRLLPSYYRNETDNETFDNNGPAPGGLQTNNNYGNNGNVVDSDPRTISNLIVDMSFNNPAAIVAALSFAEFYGEFEGEIYGTGGALEVIQEAYAALIATLEDSTASAADKEAANVAFDDFIAGYGVHRNGSSIDIPNIAPDEGLSVPFNAWMTFFGQFFDHGLDLINKGGNGTIYVPLNADDPLMTVGADGLAGTGDELSLPQNAHLAFMVLTRATPSGDTEVNQTTPFVDQNQTYTSNASHQAFLREYTLVNNRPLSTGHLLDGSDNNETVSSLPTWADVKTQALSMLGIRLTDKDVGNVPVLRMDPYGEFVRGPNGMPQILAGIRSDGTEIWVETSLANPVDPSAIQLPVGTVLFGGNVIDAGETVSAVRTGHAFLDDIAHNAVPVVAGGVLQQDVGTAVGNAVASINGRNTEYDNELLDQHFITGDGRGNENIGLTAVHHIFHSEHNRQVEQQKLTILASGDEAFIHEWLLTDRDFTNAELASFRTMSLQGLTAVANQLSWDGERLFQAARMATEMQYQHLVFEEFARKIQPMIDPFVFNSTPDINPAIFAEFAHVVYRFGHSMLTENMPRMNADGTELDDVGLVASFLNPVLFDNDGGITDDQGAAAIIRGMTIERGNEIDEFIVDALRNNLLGLPLDLAAINIARGRDTGMPSLNQARQALYDASGSTFLEPYEHWVDFAANLKNPVSVINFIAAYGTHASITSAATAEAKRDAAWLLVMGDYDINGDGIVETAPADRMQFLTATGAYTNKGGLNEIDLWIGGLAEKKMPFGGMLGSTFNAVFELQLENLQDGDRFYYLTRTQGQNFLVSLEQNSFAKMMMANTSLAQPGADGIRGTPDDIIDRHIGVDSFGVYDFVLEVNAANQADYTPLPQEEIDAATAAVAQAQTAYNGAVATSNAADAQAALTDAAVEQSEYAALQLVADQTDAAGRLADVIAAASASPFVMQTLLDAVAAYQAATAADAAAASALEEALAAAADDTTAANAALNETAALAVLTAAQNALAELMASGGGKDPVGNNPVLEAAGLGKVIRDNLSTPGADANYLRFQGGEHVVVGGTNNDDHIVTDFGDDGIWGDAGNDRIESGAGVDLVNGGMGNDVITDSGDTGDFLKGDEGDDVIAGGNGLDIIMGGSGNDVIFHGVDDTETFAGEGNDFVAGGDGVDLIMGNEGDDWLEAGAGFDTTAGDNSELFFDSRIIGHDVMFSGSEEHDFDAESGDDIMVQGESVLRSEGMFGFDWATYDGNGQNADVDLARPIFTTEVEDVLRDRFDKVEAASGYTGNDYLAGDDRTYDPDAVNAVNATAEGVFFRDEINMAGINRITGLNQIITQAQMISGIYTSEFGDLNPNAAPELIFGGGNVLIGGGGNDVIAGKGGDDILDGDRWLNVRIRITAPGAENTAANQIATIESLKHVFTAETAGANTAWIGKSLSQLLIDRVIVPSQMHIVREILDGDAANTGVDTAVFWDVRANYTFESLGNGTFRVSHTGFGNTPIPQAVLDAGFRNVSDGVDTLRNMEMLRFGDGNGGWQNFSLRDIFNRAPTGTLAINGQPAREGATLTATVAAIQDADGINPANRTIQWQSSVDGVTWTNIPNANGTTFTPPNVAGTNISPFAANLFRVVVSYTDNAGWAEQVVSAPTGPMGIVWTAAGNGAGVTFTAFAGPDALTGSNFADTLGGAGGDDTITGGNGNDTLLGGDGVDTLNGGADNDTITGGAGNDAIDGGTGVDVAVFTGPVASYRYDVTTTVVAGADPIITDAVGNGGTDTMDNIETLRIAGVDYTVRTGTLVGNTIGAEAGNQIMLGGLGNDTLNGGDGNDILVGGANSILGGSETINGGNGNDFIIYHAGTDGRDIITGGPDNEGTDTFVLHGAAAAETFRIYTRAAWDALPGNDIASLNANTEIVITRNGTNNASIIAELNNIEEIVINSTNTTANDGGGLNVGDTTGDTIQVFGDFTAPNTSLDYSTITINGSSAADTVDITGLESDHRVVFTSNGGSDTVIGQVRTQDVFDGVANDQRIAIAPAASSFGAGDGLEALVGGAPVGAGFGGSSLGSKDLFTQTGEQSFGRTVVESWIDDQPLDLVETAAPAALAHQPVPIDPMGFLKYLSFHQHDVLPA